MDYIYNWDLLPKHLHFLCAPAEKYGKLQFDDRIHAFFDRIKNSEINALQDVSNKYLVHSKEIEKWLDSFSMEEYIESRRIYFLFYLISIGNSRNIIK